MDYESNGLPREASGGLSIKGQATKKSESTEGGEGYCVPLKGVCDGQGNRAFTIVTEPAHISTMSPYLVSSF